MDAQLQKLFSSVAVTETVDVGGFQLFGLRWATEPAADYITLDDGLAGGSVKITEVSGAGSVPDLLVINDSDMLLFLLAGEQLVGAKQNRVLNTSLLVPARSKLRVPVSCVEAGRWAYSAPGFRSSGSSSHARLRAQMMKQVSAGYRMTGEARAHQGQVWSEVSDKLQYMKSRSSSAALEQAYEDHRERLEDFVNQARVSADCHGVLFAFGGQVVGLDLFDQPATLAKLLPKLVRSYALDALELPEPKTVTPEEVAAWLADVPAIEVERFKSRGLGDDLRLHAKAVVGAGLAVEPGPVHVSLFRDDGGSRATRRPAAPPVEQQPVEPAELGTASAPLATQATDLTAFPTTPGTLQSLADGMSALRGVLGIDMRAALALMDHVTARVLRPRLERELVARTATLAPQSSRRMLVVAPRLADRWFSHWHADQGTTVVSVADWSRLTAVPVQAFLALQILLCDASRHEAVDVRALFHEATRDCLFDLCAHKPDIERKLLHGCICGECRPVLEAGGVDVARLLRGMEVVRRLAQQSG